MVRDTFKSYIWGVIIQQTALIKKQDRINMTWYEEEIKRLESEFWEKPNNISLANLVKSKYNILSTNHKQIITTFKQFYEELYKSQGELDVDKAKRNSLNI